MILFVDTSFLQAMHYAKDQHHAESLRIIAKSSGHALVMTDWVLAEFLNSFSRRGANRQIAAEVVQDALIDPAVEVIPASRGQFLQGLALYADRPDKAWSLVDCISFQLMRSRGIMHALIFDEHFEQAGFRRFH